MYRTGSRGRGDRISAIDGAESGRHRGGNGIERGQRLRRRRDQLPPLLHDVAGAARKESVSRDAEHGRHRGLLGSDATVVDRAG
jgi:hypothetical protein